MVLESLSNEIQMKRKKFLSSLVVVSSLWLQRVSRSSIQSCLLPYPLPPGPLGPHWPLSCMRCCAGRGTWGPDSASSTENPATPSGGSSAEDVGKPEHGEIHEQVQRGAWARTAVVPL